MYIEQQIKQLERQLEEQKRQAISDSKPMLLEQIDWTPVIKMCQNYIDHITSEGYEQKDIEYYIYESVLCAVFGKNVFEWIRAATS